MSKSNLFVITGFSNWGKTTTLKQVFKREIFFPTKGSIPISGYAFRYTVINPSNDDGGIARYLEKFDLVEEKHNNNFSNLVVTMCPVFDKGLNDCTEFLTNLNQHYNSYFIILKNKWASQEQIRQEAIEEIKRIASPIEIKIFDENIGGNQQKFKDRSELIKEYVIQHSK